MRIIQQAEVGMARPSRGAMLAGGRAAYQARAWDDAYRALADADAARKLEPEDLERLAWSAALTGRDEAMLALTERVYTEQLAAGQNFLAARAAFWLGFRLLILGETGRGSGWIGRAERLAERDGPSALNGYFRIASIRRALMAGDCDGALAAAREGLAIGERFHDRELVALATCQLGRVLLHIGRIEEGLGLLDEAMLIVSSEELLPIVTGLVYCELIEGCEEVFALGRAREWTGVLADWCAEQPQLVPFAGACLVRRSEILELNGEWNEALAEAARAAKLAERRADSSAAGPAHYQVAEIHRLRGEFSAAEAAYRAAADYSAEPQPGLALLRLAQNRGAESAAAIRRVLSITAGALARARFLPAAVEILLAVGAADEARAVAVELERTAARFGGEILAAMAAQATGAVTLAEGNPAGALTALRRAFGTWQQIGAPHVAARIRLLMAEACRALGDFDGATLELSSARKIFAALGAAPELDRLAVLERGEARPSGLTGREMQVLRLVASGKTNRAIAGELSLSERTIDRHVSNILTKLSVHTRAAATAYLYEHQLV